MKGIQGIRLLLTGLLGAALIAAFDGDAAYFFNYFTNTGNVIIFLLLLGIIGGYIPERHLAFGVMIGLVINIVYVNLLVDDYAIVSDIINSEWQWGVLHYVVPYGMLFLFIYGVKETMPPLKTLLVYLWLPVLYLVYAFMYGFYSGEYAYFFLDVPTTGLPSVVIYVVGIFAFYLALGALLIRWKDKSQKKRLR